MVRAQQNMVKDKQALLPQFRHDQTVLPPYSNAQISEEAMSRVAALIYDTAAPTTKKYYQLGQTGDGAEAQNWIVSRQFLFLDRGRAKLYACMTRPC